MKRDKSRPLQRINLR